YMISKYSEIFESIMPQIPNDLLRGTLNQSMANTLSGFTLGTAMSLGSGENVETALKVGAKDAANGFVTGAVSGSVSSIRRARDNKRSPWTGEKTNKHHSYPQFMGGDKNQDLTVMSEYRHKQLHKDLNDFLYKRTDEYGNHMRPQRNNDRINIQKNFNSGVRFNTMRRFYDTHPIKYWDAKYDFYKNNNMILKWRPW
uniref:hypothetical protein n=1 Tax=Prevotella sp. TaxID=59823 RepID=UPI003FD8D70F